MLKLRPSRLRRLLRQGKLSTMLKLSLTDPRAVELAGLAGVDAVWLCLEHVPNDWLVLENQLRAARLHDIDSSVRCHPLGQRALDGGNIDGLFCQVPWTDYVRHANEENLLILQIESPEALENVEAIAAVPGFDGLLFGPGDFSHRIGKVGQLDAPEVAAARRRVASAARQAGKFVLTAGLWAPFDDLLQEGHQVFNLGGDVTALGAQFKRHVAQFHAQAGGPG